MDLYRLTIQDSQDTMQFDLLDAPINIEDVEGAVDNTVLSGDIFTDFLFLKKRWEQKWAIMCKDEYERLRGFYTRQWSLATVPSVKVTQGYLKNSSWEGQIIYINAPYGGEIDGLTKMAGDTFQPTLSGKNLLNYHIATSPITTSGLTITEEEDGAIVVSGVPTANYVVISGGGNRIDITNILEDNTTYTLGKYDTNRYTFIEVRGTKVGGGYSYWGATTVASNTFTTNFANYTSYDIAILTPTMAVWGTSSRTIRHKFQLEKGNQLTSFEPYVGGQPSPNPIGNQPIRTVTGEQTINIRGKNLFDYTVWNTTGKTVLRANAVDIENPTGNTLKLTNKIKQVNNYAAIEIANSERLLGKTATISAKFKNSSVPNTKIALYWGTATTVANQIAGQDYSGESGFAQVTANIPDTFPSGTDRIRAVVYANGGISGNIGEVGTSVEWADIQLEIGSTASSYAPYISMDFPINLGKNLFDKDNATTINAWLNNAGQIVGATGTRTTIIPCQPNTTYTISKRADGNQPRFCVFDTEDVPATGINALHSIGSRGGANTSTHLTITTMSRAHWLCIFYYISTETTLTEQDILDSIQIEAGDTPTAYTAYKTPVELNDLGNGYKDEIAFDGSEWKLIKKTAHDTRDVQINGISGNTSTDSTASAKGAFSVISFTGGWTGDYATTLGVATLSSNIGQFKLNTSVTGNASAENMQDGTFCQRQGTNDRCYFRATSLIGKTGNEVRAILAPQGGVNAWWGLQTPTETTITDTDLIAQLEAVRAALIEAETLVEVIANGDNLPAKSITLQGIEGRENPILPQTNVRIGLSDGGVLNACECRQNVTLSMRETA